MTEFQKAAAAARRRYADDAWFTLSVNEQAKAIYAELRRIDAERVTALVGRSQAGGRPRRATAPRVRTRPALGTGWVQTADGLEA